MLLTCTCVTAGAAEFKGRGLYKFKSESGCPFTAFAPKDECNRIALDDADTVATLDGDATHTIRFTNTRVYRGKTIVGDVLMQGTGRARDGHRVPLTFHAVLSRSGTQWSINSHAHAPVPGNFTEVAIDPYRVIVNDEATASGRVLLTPAKIDKTMSSPSLAARLVNALVQVNDNRAGRTDSPDVTILLGVGRVAVPVMRAKFEIPADASGAKPSLDAALRAGNWSIQLQALSSRLPHDVVQRELFLYGLDTLPATQPLMRERWPQSATLRLGAVGGKGYLGLGEQRQPFDDAEVSARAFLQNSFVGLILGWQANPQPANPLR